jgi:4-diphosphocytidyl-2-C-methyl-D-erythritol kinase
VNLGLRVLGLRPDGYHEVVTWIQQVSLFDRIWMEEKPRAIRLSVEGREVPGGRENLVHRAAVALKAKAGERALGARIHLDKHIPAGAGLGGGSGNAAAALWGLNRLWGLGLPVQALRRIGASLGSDVPSFLAGPASVCRGRGERVSRRAPLRRGWFILAKPRYSLATATVYGWMREKRLRAEVVSAPAEGRTPSYRNDLEDEVFRRHPDLRAARDLLLHLGASRALMSGSGPSLWGLFVSRGRALDALARFRPGRDWERWLVRPLASWPFALSFMGPKGEKPAVG